MPGLQENKTASIPPVQQAGPLVLTRDMLPAIYANVINVKVSYAILGLLGWGFWNICMSSATKLLPGSNIRVPFWEATQIVTQFCIGLIMWGMAIYGGCTRKPVVIIADGFLTGITAVVNIVCSLLTFLLSKETAYFMFLWGFCQFFWSRQEYRSYSVIKGWLTQAREVAEDERLRVKAILGRFVHLTECFDSGRLIATVLRQHWTSIDRRRTFRGQLIGDDAIFLSKNLAHCFVVDRATAAVSPFDDNATNVLTDFGFRKFTLWPVSCIAWKRWAGRAISVGNARQAVRHYSKSLGMLQFLLTNENFRIRLLALEALVHDNYKGACQIVVGLLDDQIGEVRAAAVQACRKLRIDGLHERVIPMLQDRKALANVAAYIEQHPVPEAIEPLRQALITENSRGNKRSLKKAIRACGGDDNLYAMDVPVRQ